MPTIKTVEITGILGLILDEATFSVPKIASFSQLMMVWSLPSIAKAMWPPALRGVNDPHVAVVIGSLSPESDRSLVDACQGASGRRRTS
jgi:hypothetical protein